MLEEVMEMVNSCPRSEEEPAQEHREYFEHLEQIREKFMCLHEQLDISITNPAQQQFYDGLRETVLGGSLAMGRGYVLLTAETWQLESLVRDSALNELAVSVFERFNTA